MKIYNKKGLIWGVFWTIGGLFCLYRDIFDPHDFLPQQIKSVILSVLLLAMGVTGFVRAFSKRATIEDKTEERDERNKLVRLKGDAMVGNILLLCSDGPHAGGGFWLCRHKKTCIRLPFPNLWTECEPMLHPVHYLCRLL